MLLVISKAQTLTLPFAVSDLLGKSSVSKFLSKSPFFFPVRGKKKKTTDGEDQSMKCNFSYLLANEGNNFILLLRENSKHTLHKL